MSKRTIGLVVVMVASLATPSSAGVPWWGHWWRGTNLPVSHCASSASSAVKAVTGSQPEILTLDANTRLIKAFTADAGILVHCTAGTTTVCGKPRANLSIAVFSNANNAGALRDQINTKFGNPVLIDCN